MLTSFIILFLPNYVFQRSTLSKSPKKNESVRKKISVKEDKVLLASLDDTLDTMIGFNSESLVHSSTLTSSTGVEGFDNIQTSAIKPKVSFHYILLIVDAHLNHETVVSMYNRHGRIFPFFKEILIQSFWSHKTAKQRIFKYIILLKKVISILRSIH